MVKQYQQLERTFNGLPKVVFSCGECGFTMKTCGLPVVCPKCGFNPLDKKYDTVSILGEVEIVSKKRTDIIIFMKPDSDIEKDNE